MSCLCERGRNGSFHVMPPVPLNFFAAFSLSQAFIVVPSCLSVCVCSSSCCDLLLLYLFSFVTLFVLVLSFFVAPCKMEKQP